MMKMEQTEKDLVNKRILQETLNRQQDILTRLLESEKAELQREQEERRQSTEAKNQKFSNPSSDFQYNRQKTTATELMKTVQPSYNYFYRNKINGYFLKFE
jgi:HD-GYP domain-containing protein (c-di-GMP phosphodiesterase class II)